MVVYYIFFKLACFILHISFVMSQNFEFCADNQLFSFSKEACPGGVLFKNPIELTEPCFCLNKNLVAYSTCDFDWHIERVNVSNELKICHRSSEKRGNTLIRFLQPTVSALEVMTSDATGLKFRHKDAKCHRVLRKCANLDSNRVMQHIPPLPASTTTMTSGQNWNRQNEHLYNIRKSHRQKRDLSISNIADEKLKERIQETIDLLNELQFGSSNTIRPSSMTLQMLAKTIKIFNYITPNVIVSDEVINSVLTLFLKKYGDLELPGYSGRLIIDDQLERATFENVMGSLQECASRASDSSQEFEFVTTDDACPPKITHVVHKINTIESGFQRVMYELGKFMPEDRKYVPEKEDFILGALWKVFDTVYSYCFSSVFSYRTSQTLNNYFTIISNVFTSPWTINDYISESGQGTLMYASRIEHENLTVLMTNLDYMTEAVHMLSRFKTFFKKPVPFATSNERPKREPEITSTEPTTTSESPIFRNRNKRSINSEHNAASSDWTKLEIFGGRAYCLQVADPSFPPGIFNTNPKIEDLCGLRFNI